MGSGEGSANEIKLFRSPLATIAVLYHCTVSQSTNDQRYFDSAHTDSYAATASMAATMFIPISSRFIAVTRLTFSRLAKTVLLTARYSSPSGYA